MFRLFIKYIIKKIKKEEMKVTDISAKELKSLIEGNAASLEIIDVREQKEHDIIHVEGSKLIPMNTLLSKVEEIDWSKDVIFYCLSGSRSKMIASILDKPIKNLEGGMLSVYDEWGKYDVDLVVDKNLIGMYI